MSEYVKIIGSTTESYDTKSLEFHWDVPAKPGQFIMLWIPGIEEIPMSLSKIDNVKGVTIKGIGDSTKKLIELGYGDTMSVRGPYGNGFDLSGDHELLIIGGGVGAAAIMPAVKETGADTILAARSKQDLILVEVAKKYCKNLSLATDDGSEGFHGNAVELMKQKLTEKKYDMVIACGPEIMLYYLHKACVELNVDCQLSLERHMKCGAGVCGCCAIDEHRVCKDGPVFTRDQISQMKEFNNAKRDECGCLVKFR